MNAAPKSTSDEGSGQPRRTDHVGSLEKGLAVLDALAAHPRGLTLTDTAEAVGLTRAGARRLLLTLVATGHARQEGRLFLLTPRLLTLARSWLTGVPLWEFALPHMRAVAEALNESCSAAVLADTDVVYVARVPGERIMSVSLHVGTRLPAWCTSMGRVLLGGLAPADLPGVLSRSKLVQNTPKTQTDPAALMRAIADAARDGYALVDEELEMGLMSIAVPIRERSGRIVGAINVPAQSARYTPAKLKAAALPVLRKATADIEAFFLVQ
ncbi:MAG: helix-turn-helix domain-containing protein [Rhizobiaceae bacterium]|nr:helix-turn-helix domain-containing protein [Rhizobiaceae bacterium]